MSGPIVRRYGFPNFEKIFGERELKHGAEGESPTSPPLESPADPPKATTPPADSTKVDPAPSKP